MNQPTLKSYKQNHSLPVIVAKKYKQKIRQAKLNKTHINMHLAIDKAKIRVIRTKGNYWKTSEA